MVNEEKVRIMTAIAHEEKEHGSELLNDAFFYKNDYVKMHVLSVIWNYTIGYFLILILIALYNMDYLLLNFVKINGIIVFIFVNNYSKCSYFKDLLSGQI